MASQQLLVQMMGGAPFGLRFLGGDNSPFTVAKIRPSSKAQVAGLLEGDVILAINNICAKGLSHATATGLMERNTSGLAILVLRGRNALNDTESAVASLGPEIQRLTEADASALIQSQSYEFNVGFPTTSVHNVPNGRQQEVTFRLLAPPSGGSLKQMRIAKTESRSSTGNPSEDSFVQSVEKPDYYAREERTSTGGGKTTRIVEEVKTEKLGGSTLTKVTKQEFTSYSNSSNHLPSISLQPSHSMIRSEEKGLLGAPTRDMENGGSLRDEKGWSMSTSVERSNVSNQPYYDQLGSVQKPVTNLTIHNKEPKGYLDETEVTHIQPSATIEIQFEPSLSGFGGGNDERQRVENESNFQVRVGKEVSFQPKLESHQSHLQNQPSVKIYATQDLRTEPQTTLFANDPYKSERSYGQFSHKNEPQPHVGYSEESRSGPHIHVYDVQEAAPCQHHPDRYHVHGNNLDDRFQPDIRLHSGYKGTQVTRSYLGTQPHYEESQFQLNEIPSGYSSETKPPHRPAARQEPSGIHPHFGYRPEPESSGVHLQYVSMPEHSEVHVPSGYRPTPTGVHLQLEPEPSEVHPQFGFRSESEPSRVHTHFSHRPETEPSRVHTQFGYKKELEPSGFHSQLGYRPEPEEERQLDTNVQYYHEPETQYKSDPRNQFDQRAESKSVYDSAPTPSSYSIYQQPLRADPKPEKQFHPENERLQEGQMVRGELYPLNYFNKTYYDNQEMLKDTYPLPNKWSGRLQNMDKVERIEIDSAPKWIPGSKLPIQQPVHLQSSSDHNWNRNEVSKGQRSVDERTIQPTEDGWNEPTVAVVKGMALSRIYEPKKQSTEMAQYHGISENRGPTEFPLYNQRELMENRSLAGQFGQRDQALVGYPVTRGPVHDSSSHNWKPSGYDHQRFHQEAHQEEANRSKSANDVEYYPGNDPYYHEPPSAPPPPAPPLLPHLPISPLVPVQGPTPLTPPLPPVAPPIDHLKVYRGDSSDRGYGHTTFEEKVKMANSVAHSVLSPENRNSKGQKIFLRRRDNSHKWTTQGPDPVAEKPQHQHQEARNPNVWSPAKSISAPQKNLSARNPLPTLSAPGPAPPRELPRMPLAPPLYSDSLPDQEIAEVGSQSSAYVLAEDMALNSGKGGRLFAKKRANAAKWTSEESIGRQGVSQPPPPTVNRQTSYGQHELQVPASPLSYQPSTRETESRGGELLVVNRLKDMIQPKSSVGLWNSTVTQMGPHEISMSGPYGQSGPGGTWQSVQTLPLSQARKVPGLSSSKPAMKSMKFQGLPAPMKFQGPPAISPLAAPLGQPQKTSPGVRFSPRQLGSKTIVGQGQGFTDL